MSKIFEVSANGTLMGEYKAADAASAIDACCVDAGYKSLEDSIEVTGGSADEFQAFEIDADKLLAAVEEASGESSFQDSYGNGVAVVKGESYATYRGLADAFGLDVDSFRV